VLASFVVMAGFGARAARSGDYPRVDLLRWAPARALAHPVTLSAVRLLSVGLFALVIAAGLLGNPDPARNALPATVWVFWWVGLAYLCALVGDAWRLLNPWNSIFAGAERLVRRIHPAARLSFRLPYPEWLGAWPAVLLFFGFAWMELVWRQGHVPAALARAVLIYSAITWLGMVVFGREPWLRGGETFSVIFSLFARFAPTEVRVATPSICASCTSDACRHGNADCVNCYECYGEARPHEREWNLRPFAVGLIPQHPVPPSMMAFVLVALATVTFDGLKETTLRPLVLDAVFYLPGARTFMPWLARASGDIVSGVLTILMVVFVVLVMVSYLLLARLIARAGGAPSSSGAEAARWFVLTLMPISLAYHLAHYLSYFLIYAQSAIPLSSDPFGLGWNLLGTAGYKIDIGIVDARFAWYTAVAAIVLGHVVAVYLAHATAARAYADARAALRSQYPMVAAMIGYTALSLWILAQPIVTG
jgi:hypothetical protein